MLHLAIHKKRKKEDYFVMKKPPIGIIQRGVWIDRVLKERVDNLLAAMKRYSDAGKMIPSGWINELGDHQAGVLRDSLPMRAGDRKDRALRIIIEKIIARHERGLIALDEPSFELFELAKRIRQSDDEKTLQDALKALADFKK